MMTKTLGTRTTTLAYALAGLAAFAGLLALVIWTITPAERGGDITPQSPVDVTAYWTILGVTAAITLLVITPLALLSGPKIVRRWIHRNDDSEHHATSSNPTTYGEKTSLPTSAPSATDAAPPATERTFDAFRAGTVPLLPPSALPGQIVGTGGILPTPRRIPRTISNIEPEQEKTP